jgi:hypothetical protein
MKRYAAIVFACTALCAASVSAQTRPNFAGKWQFEVERTKGANLKGWADGVHLGAVTLGLQGNTLTYTAEGAKPTVRTYKLDGSEQEVSGEQGARASAKWDGSKIVIVTIRTGAGGEVKSVSEYTIENGTLVITTTAPPRGGGATMTNVVYYKRA